jgi:hypothetical protein
MNGKNRKARKEHRCVLCGGEIAKGEKYHDEIFYPSENPVNETPFNYKAHLDCHEFPLEQDWSDGFVEGEVIHDELDYSDNCPSKCLYCGCFVVDESLKFNLWHRINTCECETPVIEE